VWNSSATDNTRMNETAGLDLDLVTWTLPSVPLPLGAVTRRFSEKKQPVAEGLRKKDVYARGVLAGWVKDKKQGFINYFPMCFRACMQKGQKSRCHLACNLFGKKIYRSQTKYQKLNFDRTIGFLTIKTSKQDPT
jgi:hypothetical protein